ncbi:MAG TPA: ribonuclease H-like domain-containing protein, partial [Chthonomonadales bacterium]|nr:ribonuclease H-like domain-containing protein [Chthonomonadales bacterium]
MADRSIPPSLLEATFLHAPGIGRTTEQRLWQAGASHWNAYLSGPEDSWPLTSSQRAALTPTIHESVQRLEEEDFAWFRRTLPTSEHWRAVPAFGHRLAFVDIETTGGFEPHDLTVIGLYDGFRIRQFVKGVDLDQFPAALQDAALIVTFFGTGFDLPFLRRTFPELRLDQLHVDLCFLYRRLGLRGGLKSIESRMGIRRSAATTGLGGMDAVRLWQEFQRGRAGSLNTL